MPTTSTAPRFCLPARHRRTGFAFLIAAASLAAVALVAHNVTAQGRLHDDAALQVATAGDPLPRIQCRQGYTATIYAKGLTSPDGLAFDPDGVLHVAEESAGRVSRIEPAGSVSTVLTGLSGPEGIAFDDASNLYVVEDIEHGRLVKRSPGGMTQTLISDLDAPEGVAWSPNDGLLYVTESNIQFETNPLNLRTRVSAVSSSGAITPLITSTPSVTASGSSVTVTFWSYAGIVAGPEGFIYVTNELSNRPVTQTLGGFTFTLITTDSIFTVNPSTPSRAVFAGDLFTPEGLRFSAGGGFPMFVAEENTGSGGRLSRVESDGRLSPWCTGFFTVEDVEADRAGNLYVSEDQTGYIIRVELAYQTFLAIVLK